MRKINISDFKNFKFLSWLKFSPDGKNSALIASMANNNNSYDAYIWTCSEKKEMKCIAKTSPERLFIWESPDSLLYSAAIDEKAEESTKNNGAVTRFDRISLSGGEAEEAFSIELNVKDIKHLEDSVFVIKALNNSKNLLSDNNNDSDKWQQGYQIIDELPYWFNGSGFINGMRDNLYIYNSSTRQLKPISDPDDDVDGFQISQDKKNILYSLKHYSRTLKCVHSLHEYDLISQKSKCLMNEKYDIGEFSYCEQGIVFTGTQGIRFGINENRDFYILPRNSSNEILLAGHDATIGAPVGSDCRLGGGITFKVFKNSAYFTSSRGYDCNLYRINLDSGLIESVTSFSGSIDFFDISPSGLQAIAFLDMHLQELYSINNNDYTLISSLNTKFCEEKSITTPIHESFKDKDGFQIDGWIVLPPDYDEYSNYPAILNIHGGPKSLFGDIYFHEIQYWANRGYIVIFCNPRGGDGKGNEFADVRGCYGTFDYDDMMAFTDEMIKKYPAIDENRIGVTGGSYGGFMVNWIIGHTDRFKAAASQRCISNWLSFTCTSDIGYFWGPDQLGFSMWENAEKMWDFSPLKYADKVKTPTLFIHSQEDYRCCIPEGYQMYSALKYHNVPTRMCIFHGENHELSRSGKPENREKRLKEITDWMDSYLK